MTVINASYVKRDVAECAAAVILLVERDQVRDGDVQIKAALAPAALRATVARPENFAHLGSDCFGCLIVRAGGNKLSVQVFNPSGADAQRHSPPSTILGRTANISRISVIYDAKWFPGTNGRRPPITTDRS